MTFAINDRGTFADLLEADSALMPSGYYTLVVPGLLRQDRHALSALRRAELDKFGAACRTRPELRGVVQTLFDVMLPRGKAEAAGGPTLTTLLEENGFDRAQHEQIRQDLKQGRIGLAQNRLAGNATIEDAGIGDVQDVSQWRSQKRDLEFLGRASLRKGEVAVVTLAAGAGSRWTQGAGVVKALHPFCRLGGRHRTFIEVHLAKNRRVARSVGTTVPHVFTTSYLTHAPTEAFLARQKNYGYRRPPVSFPRQIRRLAPCPHGAGPAFPLGRIASAKAR